MVWVNSPGFPGRPDTLLVSMLRDVLTMPAPPPGRRGDAAPVSPSHRPGGPPRARGFFRRAASATPRPPRSGSGVLLPPRRGAEPPRGGRRRRRQAWPTPERSACRPAGGGGSGDLAALTGLGRHDPARGLWPPLVRARPLLLADLPREGDAPWIFGFPSERHFRLGERFSATGRSRPSRSSPARSRDAGARGRRDLKTGDSAATGPRRRGRPAGSTGSAAPPPSSTGAISASSPLLPLLPARPAPVEGFAVFAFVGEEAWAAELWLPPGGEWYPSLLAVAADLRAAGLRRWRFWPPPPGTGWTAFSPPWGAGRGSAGSSAAAGAPSGADDPVAAAAGFFYAMGITISARACGRRRRSWSRGARAGGPSSRAGIRRRASRRSAREKALP